jgi:5-methylcytosine-specific restriction endonuclease McrA
MLTLRAAVMRRYNSIVKRSLAYRIDPPDKELFYQKAEESMLDGFTCCYCGCKLKITEPTPALSVFSFDHYLPIVLHGNNAMSNIVICCHSCNIIKGTMTGDTYKELLSYIPVALKNRMFMEIFRGRIADKIERVQGEAEMNDAE